MKKLLIAAFVLFILVCVVFAADWYPAVVRAGWNQRSSGFCPEDTQCLVSSAGDRSYDGKPEQFFSDPKPYCINNSQFILDFYCDAGSWSSRTELLALELLKLASSQSPNDFSLFCAPYKTALNNIDYNLNNIFVRSYFKDCNPYNAQENYPCTNSVCVLKYSDGIAFGTSLNIPIDDSRSFLNALGKSSSYCNRAKDSDNQFNLCNDNIWYNHNTESVIVLPKAYSGNNLPTSNLNVNVYLNNPFNVLKSLALSSNIDFFGNSRIFNNLYFAKKNNKEVFSFLETDQTDFSYDYIGVYMKDLGISNLCNDVIFALDSNAVCDDSGDVLVIAKKTPDIDNSLVNLWADLTAKLRLS